MLSLTSPRHISTLRRLSLRPCGPVAAEARVPPTRISFVTSLAMIREELLGLTLPRMTPGAIPASLGRLRRRLKRLVLPPRRPERSYPRAVKIKMSNYARKRPVVK